MPHSSQSFSARVLPFVAPSPDPITMPMEDRLARIRAVDPEGADTIERYVNAMYALRVERGPRK